MRPSSNRMRSPTRTSRASPSYWIGMTRSSVDASPSTSVTSTPEGRSNLRGNAAGADLRAAEVLQHRDRLSLRAAVASRRRASRAACSSCVPWEKLRRATSMPASMRLRRPSIESHAGPSVQTSFARRNADMDGPRIVALAPLAPSTLEKAQQSYVSHSRFGGTAGLSALSALSGASLAEVARGDDDPRLRLRSRRHGGEARALRAAFDGQPHLVAYALKANAAGAVVRTFAAEGCGADVVSGGRAARRARLRHRARAHRLQRRRQDRRRDRPRARLRSEGHRRGPHRERRGDRAHRGASARRSGAGRASAFASIRASISPEQTHAHIATGHDRAKFGVPRDDVARRGGARRAVAAPRARRDVGARRVRTSRRSRRTSSRREVLFGLVRSLREAGAGVARVRRHRRRLRGRLPGDGRAAAARRVRARRARVAARARARRPRALRRAGRCLVARARRAARARHPAEGHGDGAAGS